MPCPNCESQMASFTYDGQEVYHCPACATSYFSENGVNRITLESARILAVEPSEVHPPKSPYIKSCPRDKYPLNLIMNNPAIPQNVSLYQCPFCKGVAVSAKDLLAFKKAQAVKIEYYKAWNKPMPSIKTVLVLSTFVFVFASILYTQFGPMGKFGTPAQAEDVVKHTYESASADRLLISFQTTKPFRSRIILEDKDTKEIVLRAVSTTPQTLHTVTISPINISHSLFYKIALADDTGKEIFTKEMRVKK